MAKTHHRRRHRRANRTRRGGTKSNPNPKPVLDAEASQILAGLFAKVDAAASQASAAVKPSKTSGIAKSAARSAAKAANDFQAILSGKKKPHSSKYSSKYGSRNRKDPGDQ
jgi:TorA maturation chaperone TorD